MRRAYVLLVLLLGSSLRAYTQTPAPVEVGTSQCASCVISVDFVTRLTGTPPNRSLVPYGSLTVTSAGEVLFGSTQTGGEIYRFTRHGAFAQVIGRTGPGPGELRRVTGITTGAADTIIVVDGISRLMNRFTIDGRFIDRTHLPGGVRDVIHLGGTRLFANAVIPTRAAIGFPLHLIDSGEILKSFGGESKVVDANTAGSLIRFLAAGPDGTVQAAHRLSYRIETYTTTAIPVAGLTRRLPWFPPSSVSPRTSPHMERPQPRVAGIYQADDSLLWVYLHRAPDKWRPAPLMEREGRRVPESDVLDGYLETVIEVIDLRRRTVMAAFRSRRALFPIGRGFLAAYEEDASGDPTYAIFRARLSKQDN